MAFEVDEVEAFEGVSFVLEDSRLDVAGHAGVEDAGLAGEDVDVVELRHSFSLRVVGDRRHDLRHMPQVRELL